MPQEIAFGEPGKRGMIVVIVGAMFAGKTEAFISLITRVGYSKCHKLRVFSPFEANRVITTVAGTQIDTTHATPGHQNFNAVIASRNGATYDATGFSRDNPRMILDFIQDIKEHRPKDLPTVVAIEEVQFCKNDDLLFVCETLANPPFNMVVIASGLDTDFHGHGFGPIPELMARADELIKVKGVCRECGCFHGTKTW